MVRRWVRGDTNVTHRGRSPPGEGPEGRWRRLHHWGRGSARRGRVRAPRSSATSFGIWRWELCGQVCFEWEVRAVVDGNGAAGANDRFEKAALISSLPAADFGAADARRHLAVVSPSPCIRQVRLQRPLARVADRGRDPCATVAGLRLLRCDTGTCLTVCAVFRIEIRRASYLPHVAAC